MALGILGVCGVAASVLRRPPADGLGLYALPGVAIFLTPPLLLVYLGARVVRGERMAAFALAAMAAISGAAVALVDRRGFLVLATLVVILSPLVWAALRHPGRFR